MVNNTVHAVYTETYDLNTAVGELSILGIHTPRAKQIRKIFAGLWLNYKKCKVLGCNLKMVCASTQSLDPSQMGLEAGQVDPRDVLNPILFKACTGESLNALLDVVYAGAGNVNADLLPSSVDQHITSNQSALKAYYQLLADETFRKSHPQGGLEVMHLVPLVHRIVSARPIRNMATIYNGDSVADAQPNAQKFNGSDIDGVTPDLPIFSNGTTPLPAFNTAEMYIPSTTGAEGRITPAEIPRVVCGCIVLPPAILQRLFFRLQIVWHLEFSEFRPAQDMGSIATDIYTENVGLGVSTNTTYFQMYHNPTSSRMPVTANSIDATDGVEIETIMEKGL